MRKNKFIDIITEIEKKYDGQIVQLINNSKVKMSECEDIYQPKAVNKYKRQIVKETVDQVESIRQQFFKDVADKLDAEQAKLNGAGKADTRTNTEKLLDAITLQNKMQLTAMDLKFKDTSELINMGKEVADDVILKQIKCELLERSEKMDNKTEAQTLRLTTKSLTGYTDHVQMDEVKDYFQDMINNKDYLPGVEYGTRMAIGNVETYLNKDIKDIDSEI